LGIRGHGSLISTKQGANQHRWQLVAKDKAFTPLLPRVSIETPTEVLLKVMQAGTVSTNVFLRRSHNFCVDMNRLAIHLRSAQMRTTSLVGRRKRQPRISNWPTNSNVMIIPLPKFNQPAILTLKARMKKTGFERPASL